MSVLMAEDTSCSACDVDCVTDKYRLANPPRGATSRMLKRDALAASRYVAFYVNIMTKFLLNSSGFQSSKFAVLINYLMS